MKRFLFCFLTFLLALTLMLSSCKKDESNEDNDSNDTVEPGNNNGNTSNDENTGSSDHTHSYTEKIADEKHIKSAASCTCKAIYYVSCSCGENGEETFEYGELKEHSWTDANCVTPQSCSVCGTVGANALGHNYVSAVTPPTCINSGFTTYTCSVCADTYNDNKVSALGHKYEQTITAPSCTKSGFTTYTCSVCADTYDDNQVSALGHKYEQIITAPSCTESGFTTYTCSVCNDSYDDNIVSALGHSYNVSTIAPTCTEGGYTTHTCSSCGYEYYSDRVSELGHSYTTIVTPPSCTENGYTTYTCSVCNNSYNDNTVTAKGHDWKAATCTSPKTCSVCSTTEGSPAGHNYVDGICTVCADSLASEGLVYEISEDGSFYTVTDLGECIDEDIVIPSKYNGVPVKAIAPYAFESYLSIKSVTVLEGITDIGASAFGSCSNLVNICLPNSLKTVGQNLFYNCPIETAVVPVIAINYIAGTSLTNLTITSGSSIPSDALNGCISLKSVVLPEGINTIEKNAFYGCTGLTSINIPNSVTKIEDGAFSGCSSLKTVVINENSQLLRIGEKAFENCQSIENICIPKNVTFISAGAFSGCASIKEIVIPDSVTYIGLGAFSYCTSLECITIPYIGSSPDKSDYTSHFGYIFGTSSVTSVATSRPSPSETSYHFKEYYSATSTYSYYQYYLYSIPESLKKVVLGDNVTSIHSYAFYNCAGLTEILLPEGLQSINDSSFAYCTNLMNISIPASVSLVRVDSFLGASKVLRMSSGAYYVDNWLVDLAYTNLTSIAVRRGTVGIAAFAFSGSTKLTTVTLPEGLLYICDYAFSECTALTSIAIPNGVISIGENAFKYCSGITEVTIGKGLTHIGEFAFTKCTSLKSIIMPDTLTFIGYGAFYNCSSLTTITIPSSVTRIEESAFSNCTSLKDVYITDISAWCSILFGDYNSNPLYYAENLYLNEELVTDVVVPDGVAFISDYAFYSYDKLTSIVLPEGIESIGTYAFRDCACLSSITIPDSVTEIKSGAFYNCAGLASIIFGKNSKLTTIGDYAFELCRALTTITVPVKVTSIGEKAFYNCYKLIEVINKSSLSIYTTGTNNGYIGYYALKVLPSGNSQIINQDGLLFYDANGAMMLIGYVGEEKDLILPETYNGKSYQIIKYAFYGLELNSLTIPDGIIIEKGALNGCKGLTSITLSLNAKYLGYLFGDEEANYIYTEIPSTLTDIVITGGYIYNESFRGCRNIVNVTVSNISTIGSYAFYGCSALETVSLCEGITDIGSYAFYECSALSNITLPSSLTYIGEYAFKGCAFSSASISASVVHIGKYAFAGCVNLKSVSLEYFSWWYASSSNASYGTHLDSEALSDPATVATYLTLDYVSYYWKH